MSFHGAFGPLNALSSTYMEKIERKIVELRRVRRDIISV
jgi:hypothetical protein